MAFATEIAVNVVASLGSGALLGMVEWKEMNLDEAAPGMARRLRSGTGRQP